MQLISFDAFNFYRVRSWLKKPTYSSLSIILSTFESTFNLISKVIHSELMVLCCLYPSSEGEGSIPFYLCVPVCMSVCLSVCNKFSLKIFHQLLIAYAWNFNTHTLNRYTRQNWIENKKMNSQIGRNTCCPPPTIHTYGLGFSWFWKVTFFFLACQDFLDECGPHFQKRCYI